VSKQINSLELCLLLDVALRVVRRLHKPHLHRICFYSKTNS